MSAQVADGVTRLGTEIVNWYVVEDDGRLTVVDAGLPGYGRHLEADLASAGYKLGDVEAVVLTHSDSDHFGMAAQMQDAGARVLVHVDDEPKLRKPEARAVVRGACKAVSASPLARPVEPVGSHLRELARAIDGMDQEDGDGR